MHFDEPVAERGRLSAVNIFNFFLVLNNCRAESKLTYDDVATVLRFMLESYGSQECSCLQDKVFGFAGLLKHVTNSYVLPEGLEPDYRRDPTDVIMSATRRSLFGTGTFHIGAHRVRRSPVAQLLPSWVPDFFSPRDPNVDERPFREYSIWEREENELLLDHPNFHTGTRILSLILLPVSTIIARVHATLALGCKDLTHAELKRNASLEKLGSIHPECAISCVHNVDEWTTFLQQVEDVRIEHHINPEDCVQTLTMRARLEQLSERGRSIESNHTYLLDQFRQTSLHEENPGRLRALIGAIDNTCRHRRVFITSDGRMGVGPRTGEVGDVVAVLAGCSHYPVVLRPREKQYELIGPIYVDNFSPREAVKDYKKSGRLLKWHELI